MRLKVVRVPELRAPLRVTNPLPGQKTMRDASYPISITPAVVGILIGALLASVGHGTQVISTIYTGLPEFHLWRTGMVAQAGIYLAVSAFIWRPHAEWGLPKIPRTEAALTIAFTVLVVMLPTMIVEGGPLPLPRHASRMLMILLFGLIAVIGITYRVAQLHTAFRTVEDLRTYSTLRHHARDLLGLAALVVTMATLGSGLLQISLRALADAYPGYESPLLTDRHVIAYGGYFSMLLVLFFTPLIAAERAAALRFVETKHAGTHVTPEDLGVHSSFTEYTRSAFGVLAPLLGALATRLLS